MSVNLDPNVPGAIPPGYVVVVNGGPVEPKDKLWTPESGTYEEAEVGDLGRPVDSYKRVVRPR